MLRETAVHKVTAFITRRQQERTQLLLFRHPNAGIQIPAGTIEEGEDWQTAVLREAAEETGLTQLTIQRYLGQIENELAADECIITRDGQILSQPDLQSLPYLPRFTRGYTMKFLQQQGNFSQVSYLEYDQWPNPQAIRLHLTGWLPNEAICRVKIRHYVLLHCHQATPDQWTLPSDLGHEFAPFWADLQPKPSVVMPQNRWLDDVYEALLAQEWQS